MIDFSIWFNVGWYGGLTCCMLAIAINVLYSVLRQRGRTRQFARVIILCVISTLLLIPAIIWFNSRFSTQQDLKSIFEVMGIMIYVALFGWMIPLGLTSFHCLFALPHSSSITGLNLVNRHPSTMTYLPPRHQPGVEAPFVFGEETPWGWLEYYSGSFHGQRLALKRAIITIGRDEQCDIWLDDDMASRHHAELSWHNGKVYLTDCESLNGVLLNKRPVRGTAIVESNDLLQIGTHSFVFVLAEQKDILTIQDDPLTRHTWRSTQDLQTAVSQPIPLIEKPIGNTPDTPRPLAQEKTPPDTDRVSFPRLDQTAQLDYAAPLPQLLDLSATLLVRDGELAGQKFGLEHPLTLIGHGKECDIEINDVSISRQHAQFLRQADGVYVQDLGSRNGSRVNGEPLLSPRLLNPGDIIAVGHIRLEYTLVPTTLTTHTPPSPVSTGSPNTLSSLPRMLGGPTPLKLPSKPRI